MQQQARPFQSGIVPPAAPASHPYLVKKHIGIHGARLGRDNTLAIPLYNAKKELVNLQFISGNGGKRFLSGGQKKAVFIALVMGKPTRS